jgi:hypothetical protein
VDTVCSACGEQNAPGTSFCSHCGAYLDWQTRGIERIAPTESVVVAPSAATPPPAEVADVRDSFEAGIVTAHATVPVDGTPATVTVNVANSSTLVDSYVVEPIDPPHWLAVRSTGTELLPNTEGTLEIELRVSPPALVTAQEIGLQLRVRNTTGRATRRDLWLRVRVPEVIAPLVVRAEPRLLRAREDRPGVCTVVVDNKGSNKWAEVRLTASDPEGVVRASWGAPVLQVPADGEADTKVRFDAPPAAPGEEVSRTITITSTDGQRSTETTVTFAQATPRAAIEQAGLRLDPSVLRLGSRHRGQLTAVVDNRSGSQPVRLSLHGDDPENRLRFAISPATVVVEPGRQAAATVTITAPRAPTGQEVTLPFSVTATDGRTDTRAEGSVLQLTPSRRGLARVLVTLIGAAMMIMGALLPFVAEPFIEPDRQGIELSADVVADEAGTPIPDGADLAGAEDVVSVGLLLVILAVLAAFGLTGPGGKLTRVAALLGAVLGVGTVIGSVAVADGTGPAQGAVLAFAGCVTAYVGGYLARR